MSPSRSLQPFTVALLSLLVLPTLLSPTGAFAKDAGAKHGHLAEDRYRDAEKWAAAFESPDRDAWQKPDEVIAALKLPADAKVADIGAGTGYFPVRLAKRVPKGIVYAIDLEPNMVAYVDARAKREGLKNLRGVAASADDPKLPEPVDLVLNVNTYHHLEDRPAYFRRVAKGLRPGGRVAVIDFKPESKMGPPADHKFSEEKIVRELEEAGFRLAERHAFLPEQHFLVFAPKAAR